MVRGVKRELPKARSKKHHKAQMEGLQALYGDAKKSAPITEPEPAIEPKPKPKPKPKKRKGSDEYYEQCMVATHCDKMDYPFYAIPNGAKRSLWEAMVAKKSGMKSGILDLCFPWPNKALGVSGMYIEMKRKDGGKISPPQHYWLGLLKWAGYSVHVCNGADEAIGIIDKYFEGFPGLPADIIELRHAVDMYRAEQKIFYEKKAAFKKESKNVAKRAKSESAAIET